MPILFFSLEPKKKNGYAFVTNRQPLWMMDNSALSIIFLPLHIAECLKHFKRFLDAKMLTMATPHSFSAAKFSCCERPRPNT